MLFVGGFVPEQNGGSWPRAPASPETAKLAVERQHVLQRDGLRGECHGLGAQIASLERVICGSL